MLKNKVLNLPLVIVLTLLLALLLAGCDMIESQALKVYMALNQNIQIGDAPRVYHSNVEKIKAEAVVEDLEFPWDLAFINREDILITEKPGRLSRVNLATGISTAITGVPEVAFDGQGGLLGVALHPDFKRNQLIYMSYSTEVEKGRYTTRLMRAKLVDNTLIEKSVLFSAEPATPGFIHFGGAMVFDQQGYLLLSVGDRRQSRYAQQLNTHLGKIVRLKADGAVPADNPFLTTPDARPEIFTWGHRNPQGLDIDPVSGDIWETEHGPQGGDEINLIVAGNNYGWPIITYGEQYGGGKIGEGTAKDGMEQPVHYYVPSIATAGIAFYNGEQFPNWQGSLFIAGLRLNHVNRVSVNEGKFVSEERLFNDLNMRIRNIEVSPDGIIYVLSENGVLFRITQHRDG